MQATGFSSEAGNVDVSMMYKTCLIDKKQSNAKPLIDMGLAFLLTSYKCDYGN
jgi:hypothetical protein